MKELSAFERRFSEARKRMEEARDSADELLAVAKLRKHIRLAEFVIKVANSDASDDAKFDAIFSDDVHGELPKTKFNYNWADKGAAVQDYKAKLLEVIGDWRLIIKAVDEGES